MKTPKKNVTKKSAPKVEKKSVLKKNSVDPAFLADSEDDEFDVPMDDLELDGLDSIDDDEDDF